MPPEKVLFFLNRYLGKMMEILLDHRAIVDEIVGDGILAFFGAPVPMEDHPPAPSPVQFKCRQRWNTSAP